MSKYLYTLIKRFKFYLYYFFNTPYEIRKEWDPNEWHESLSETVNFSPGTLNSSAVLVSGPVSNIWKCFLESYNKELCKKTYTNFLESKITVFGKDFLFPFVEKDLSIPLVERRVGEKSFSNLVNYDHFADFTFKRRKKYKPAYFNKADIKVPYEIARLQFFQKILLYMENENIELEEASRALSKLYEIIRYIDFTEKPKLLLFNSPMEVAIRNINLLFYYRSGSAVYSKFSKSDTSPDIFKKVMVQIVRNLDYLERNLENKGNVVGNHYLIQLSSILLTFSELEPIGPLKRDFDYYLSELKLELKKQFYQDGTNFEGSTHYSAFVIEALIVCKFAIEEVYPGEEILEEIKTIIKANRTLLSKLIIKGELSQIGDNDSGRLFYTLFNEDKPLQMSWLIDLIDYIYEGSTKDNNIKDQFITEIKKDTPQLNDYKKVLHKPIKIFSRDYEFSCFDDFGIYIWRNEEEYFSIRCGLIGQDGFGGHSHYDQLSIECYTNNKWVARDPGTGTYTDDIKVRNKFRSAEYHWGPKAKIKFPKEDEFDCFRLNHMTDGVVLDIDKSNFLGYAEFNRKRIYRKIRIEEGIVHIEDYSNDVELEEYASWGEDSGGVKAYFSEGYKRII